MYELASCLIKERSDYMYYSLNGKIIAIESTYIAIECGGVGYLIYTPNPYSFEIGKDYFIYVSQQVREDDLSLYGFKTKEEKDLFLRLIAVKGLGPKMALPILATGSIPGIIDAIDRENLLYLKKFPKIGDKLAKQIILDLKGKIAIDTQNIEKTTETDELIDVLKGLGYKEKDIKGILPKVDNTLSIEDQIKDALKLLLR